MASMFQCLWFAWRVARACALARVCACVRASVLNLWCARRVACAHVCVVRPASRVCARVQCLWCARRVACAHVCERFRMGRCSRRGGEWPGAVRLRLGGAAAGAGGRFAGLPGKRCAELFWPEAGRKRGAVLGEDGTRWTSRWFLSSPGAPRSPLPETTSCAAKMGRCSRRGGGSVWSSAREAICRTVLARSGSKKGYSSGAQVPSVQGARGAGGPLLAVSDDAVMFLRGEAVRQVCEGVAARVVARTSSGWRRSNP